MRVAVACLLAAAGLSVAGCGSGGGGSQATTASAGGGGRTISIGEKEYSLDPSSVHLNKDGTVTFRATNNGKIDHALEVEGQGVEQRTATIAPGKSVDLTVTLTKPGKYEFYCPVDGHRGLGMQGTLTVGGAAGGGGGGGATTQGGTTSGGGYGYG